MPIQMIFCCFWGWWNNWFWWLEPCSVPWHFKFVSVRALLSRIGVINDISFDVIFFFLKIVNTNNIFIAGCQWEKSFNFHLLSSHYKYKIQSFTFFCTKYELQIIIRRSMFWVFSMCKMLLLAYINPLIYYLPQQSWRIDFCWSRRAWRNFLTCQLQHWRSVMMLLSWLAKK